MHTTARNVEQMYYNAVTATVDSGVTQASRNGNTLELPGVTCLTVLRPNERVVFSVERDCNPFFHVIESVWMFAGRNDTEFLTNFVKTMANFSDNGSTFNAAYGHRMRRHFGFDQLSAVVEVLKKDPDSRQAIIQLWDPQDLTKVTKDKACNMSIDFKIRKGKLNMTVYNRSNDLIWGALGANTVHMSYFQEYVASAVGVELGVYNQVSTAMHTYTDLPKWPAIRDAFADDVYNRKYRTDIYNSGIAKPYPLVKDPLTFLRECEVFCLLPNNKSVHSNFINPFFKDIVSPMYEAYMLHKAGNTDMAIELINTNMPSCDWKIACTEWLERRLHNKPKKSPLEGSSDNFDKMRVIESQ